MTPTGTLVNMAGVRQALSWLVEQVGAAAAQARANPRLLALPLRVVVASNQQRDALLARLAHTPPGAVLGLKVQTLWQLALEVLALAGERPPPVNRAWLGVSARPLAQNLPHLSRLENYEDALYALGAVVEDFLDAGLTPLHGPMLREAAREAAAALGAPRIAETCDVALQVARLLPLMGVDRPGGVQQKAAELLASGAVALPHRGLWVAGVEEATGVSTDLLCALVRQAGATVVLVTPPHPGQPGQWETGGDWRGEFVAQLARAAGVAALPLPDPQDIPPPRLLFHADLKDGETQLQEVASVIRQLLDTGTPPESIGVVARQLPPLAAGLRRIFGQWAIPFSGAEAEPPGLLPLQRRWRAALGVLRHGPDADVHHWLDGLGENWPHAAHTEDLRLGLCQMGAVTLKDVAAIALADVLKGQAAVLGYPLNTRRGLAPPDEGEGGEEIAHEENDAGEEENDGANAAAPGPAPVSQRRRLSPAVLQDAVAWAKKTLSRQKALTRRQPLSEHARHTLGVLAQGLGWREDHEIPSLLAPLIAPEGPGGLPLEAADFFYLAGELTARAGAGPLGGQGGGVQVMGVTQARGLAFDHLFLLDLNRDVFPRVIHEDPLLGEAARDHLRAVLPQLPLKRLGHEEEAFLFAQLLTTADTAHLCWPVRDAQGRELAPSVFLTGLRDTATAQDCPMGGPPPPSPTPPLHRAATLSLAQGATGEDKEHWLACLSQHAARSLAQAGAPLAHEAPLAHARRDLLAELEPAHAPRHVGPFAGWCGQPPPQPLFVTTLEKWWVCPWRTLVMQGLHLRPPGHWLGALPSLTPALVGVTVHGALAFLARPDHGRADAPPQGVSLHTLLSQPPHLLPRPPQEKIRQAVHDAAAWVADEEGCPWPGFVLALEEAALPLVAQAVAHDWPGGGHPLPVLGVEVAGELAVALPVAEGAPPVVTLHFLADRVELDNDNQPVFTDFKTGRPYGQSQAKDQQKALAANQKKFERSVLAGQRLQALAYAAACGQRPGVGRYVFLGAEVTETQRELRLNNGDRVMTQAMTHTLGPRLWAWGGGVFFPRLFTPGNPDKANTACKHCEVQETCVKHETSLKRRAGALWGTEKPVGDDPLLGLLHGAASLWQPPADTGGEDSAPGEAP